MKMPSGFDPFDELQTAIENINEIGKAVIHQQDVLSQVLIQNRQLNELIKRYRIELDQLRIEVDELKKQ